MRSEGARILLTGAVWASIVAAAPAQVIRLGAGNVVVAGTGGKAESSAKPIPLINADEEMAAYLKRSQEMIANKDYVGAIEILQALLSRPEQCFVSTEDPCRFVSLAAKAGEVIGSLPAEGMRLYRSLYDPPADRLLQAARANHDRALLREIIERYLHTTCGDAALNLLGAVLFDRGEFSQAARCWRRLIRSRGDSRLSRPVLLVKIAVAHHFAGEEDRSREALVRLKKDYPESAGVFGGKTENAVVFAERLLASPPPEFQAQQAVREGWRSLAGAPNSVAPMTPCRPVLRPRWTRPGGKVRDNPTVEALVNSQLPAAADFGGNQAIAKQYQRSVELDQGRVVFTGRVGAAMRKAILPAVIHPVVVGTTVICREAGGVVAYDLLTGEKLWDTFEAFPLFRQFEVTGAGFVRHFYGRNLLLSPEDEGLCTLTVGDGKVFAVGKFRPQLLPHYVSRNGKRMQIADTSVLAAFSLGREGKLVWRSEEGTDEFLGSCRFVSAPTYEDGKLYVVARRTETYYLVCLSAEDGRMVWAEPPMISQAPLTGRASRSGYPDPTDRGSPPAVADGRVFACTNAGVVAAFDADSGRAVWAYQYRSEPARTVRAIQRSVRRTGVTSSYPPNPVIVAKGRSLFLPADSPKLLALSADTGELEWSTNRAEQRHLTAISEARVLLSAPKLIILNAATGRQVWSASQVGEIHGRPAVMPESILASGRGRAVRVSLPDFSITQPPLTRSDGLLGNLVCVQGKLLAANAAGVSAYFTFEDAHQELTQRMARTSPEQLPALLYQRGMNAFNAGKPEKALDDLLKASDGARRTGQGALTVRTGQSLHRTYVALAGRARDNAAMLDLLKKAESFAATERSQGEMLVRMVKYYRRVGQYSRAAALAQKLTADFCDTDLPDVGIGSASDPFVRDDPDSPRFTGYGLGHDLVRGLIDEHGQGCYAAFDARARTELAAAVRTDDPAAMVRVTNTYRHAVAAPMALLRAAESHYRRALKDPRGKREHLARAGEYLSRINLEYRSSGLSASASLGRAMVYQQMKPNIAFLGLSGLERLPGQTRVSFAGISGSLEKVLKAFGSQRLRSRLQPTPLRVSITPPLGQVFGGGAEALILRDGRGRPVRTGGAVFLLRGNKLSLFDPTAESFSKGVRWEQAVPIDSDRLYRYGFSSWPYGMVAGLSEDRSVFAMACRGGFAGVDVRTGKLRWSRAAGDQMVSQLHSMAVGDDRLVVLGNTGSISVLGLSSGKTVWSGSIPRTALPWRTPPQIGAGLLVACHGRTEWQAGVYDLASRKLLGSVPLGRSGGQVHLTDDGLVIVAAGQSLRLIEPILGIDQPIWTVRSPQQLSPAILAATDTHVLVSPTTDNRLVELRSLAHHGMIERTFRLRAPQGLVSRPIGATILADRVYVLTGHRPGVNRFAAATGRLAYSRSPHLQAFDRATGKLLWAASLDPAGKSYVYVMPLEICRDHIALLVKPQAYTQQSTAVILNARTGKTVQKMTLAGAGGVAAQRRYFRHMWLSGPVIFSGRVLLETHKGLWVYGSSP